MVNFKVCGNGTFQITGALHFDHALSCIRLIWNQIKDEHELYSFENLDYLDILVIPAMRNLDFSLNIKVNREKFDSYINGKLDTPYHCLLETSFGYTGLAVKRKITKPITDLIIKSVKLTNLNDNTDATWKGIDVSYSIYLDSLSQKKRNAKMKHTRYNTFLVFHSGKIIQTGLSANFMRKDFYDFCSLINQAHNDGMIEECLKT